MGLGKKRILSALLAVCILGAALAGCGSTPASSTGGTGGENSGSGNSAPAGATKIVVWTWDEGQFETRLQGYNAAHPDSPIEIEYVTVTANDYLTKLQQSYASGGQLPDLLAAEMAYRASAFELDVWEQLEAAPFNFDPSGTFAYAIGATRNSKGEIVAIENAQNPAGMAYKRDLALEYLGTDDPDALAAMFQTYGDYLTIGAQVYEQSGGAVTLFTGLRDVSTMMMNQARAASNVDANGDIDVSAKAQRVFETVVAMRDANVAGNITQWSSQWNAAFGMDNNILFPCAQWMPAYMIEPNDPDGEGNWGLFTPAEGGYGWGGTCYGVSKQSEHKELVWDFLQWGWMSEDGAQLSKERGSFLPIISLYDDPEYTKGTRAYFGDQQIYTLLMEEIAQDIPAVQISIYDSLIEDSMNMVVDSITADNSLTAGAALALFLEDLQNKVPDVEVK